MSNRPYIFFELTNSLCSTCMRKVEAKIVFEHDQVYMHKACVEHGRERVLISTDARYYQQQRGFLKPGQLPQKFNTPFAHGCPYDCGLCPDHEQHSCLSLIEITDQCNLTCPVCYAESSPERTTHRTLEQVCFMLDRVVENEGTPDVVQISGGEPSLHPQLFEILAEAKRRPIKHLMLNTNGLRIAQSAAFADRLAEQMPGFEVYLQFDSLRPQAYSALRGRDLLETKLRALDRLDERGISTTLVATIARGINDDEIGELTRFALGRPCVRGLTLQPVQQAGRTSGYDPALHRLTLAEVRQRLIDQQSLFAPQDVIPVPCHPDCLAMAYALKRGDVAVPLTRYIDRELLLGNDNSTIVYERNDELRSKIFELFSTAHSPQSAAHSLQQLLCCVPRVEVPEPIGYQNVFRVLIVQFMDATGFDVRSVKRSCIHIVHPDGRIIPFDTYNLFYRDQREAGLIQLRNSGFTGRPHARVNAPVAGE